MASGCRPFRRWARRVAIGVAIGVLIEAAVIAATLYRLPARLLGVPPIETFSVVLRRDELHWSVDVRRFGWLETYVDARPSETMEGAKRHVESAYDAIDLLKGGDLPSRFVPRLPGRVPGWFSTRGHDPAPYRIPSVRGEFAYFVYSRAVGWPCRCVWGETVYATVMPPLDADGRYDGSPTQHNWTRGQIEFSEHAFPLPFFPIWRGVALNLLAIASPIVLLQWGAGAWRASLGRRRRRCPVCNYDRRGLGARVACPECGEVPRG